MVNSNRRSAFYLVILAGLLTTFLFDSQAARRRPTRIPALECILTELQQSQRNFDISPDIANSFVRGQWVEIGREGDGSLPPIFVHETKKGMPSKRKIDLSQVARSREDVIETFVGRYYGRADKDHLIIEVRARKTGIPPTKVTVPSHQVYPLASGAKFVLSDRLQTLTSILPEFKPGEVVRYRDLAGLIQRGTFLRKNSGKNVIKRIGSKKIAEVQPSSTFKIRGFSKPQTLAFKDHWVVPGLENPSGVIADFLDGAGLITSHPDFVKMSIREKLETLIDYTDYFIPYRNSMRRGESAGLNHFDDIVCAGAGVCRHQSPLLATILSETGYPTRLMSLVHRNGRGHAWIEIRVGHRGRGQKTYIVDPSSKLVMTYEEAQKIAQSDPHSFEALFYTHPRREAAQTFP